MTRVLPIDLAVILCRCGRFNAKRLRNEKTKGGSARPDRLTRFRVAAYYSQKRQAHAEHYGMTSDASEQDNYFDFVLNLILSLPRTIMNPGLLVVALHLAATLLLLMRFTYPSLALAVLCFQSLVSPLIFMEPFLITLTLLGSNLSSSNYVGTALLVLLVWFDSWITLIVASALCWYSCRDMSTWRTGFDMFEHIYRDAASAVSSSRDRKITLSSAYAASKDGKENYELRASEIYQRRNALTILSSFLVAVSINKLLLGTIPLFNSKTTALGLVYIRYLLE